MPDTHDPPGEQPPLVPAVCVNCHQPVGIWGGLLYGRAVRGFDGEWHAPIAQLWGSHYTHYRCPTERNRDDWHQRTAAAARGSGAATGYGGGPG